MKYAFLEYRHIDQHSYIAYIAKNLHLRHRSYGAVYLGTIVWYNHKSHFPLPKNQVSFTKSAWKVKGYKSLKELVADNFTDLL